MAGADDDEPAAPAPKIKPATSTNKVKRPKLSDQQSDNEKYEPVTVQPKKVGRLQTLARGVCDTIADWRVLLLQASSSCRK